MQAAAPVLGDPPLGCAQASAQSAMKRQATPTEQRVSAGPRFLIQLPASRTRHMRWLCRAMIRACPRRVPNCLTRPQVCVQCGATSTPLWRNGPAGAKTLCNACGVKLQRNYNRERALRAMESEAAEQSLAAPSTPTHSSEAACASGGSHSGSQGTDDAAQQQLFSLQRSRSGSQDPQESAATSSRGRPLRASIAGRLRVTRSRGTRGTPPTSSDDDLSGRSVTGRMRQAGVAAPTGKPRLPPTKRSPQRASPKAAANAAAVAARSEGLMLPASPGRAAAVAAQHPLAGRPLPMTALQQHTHRQHDGGLLPALTPATVATSNGQGRSRVDGLQLILPGPNGSPMCLKNVAAVLQPKQHAAAPLAGFTPGFGASGAAAQRPALRVYGADGACLAFAAAPPPGGPAGVAAWRRATPQSVSWNSGYGWSLLFLRHVDYLAFKGATCARMHGALT